MASSERPKTAIIHSRRRNTHGCLIGYCRRLCRVVAPIAPCNYDNKRHDLLTSLRLYLKLIP